MQKRGKNFINFLLYTILMVLLATVGGYLFQMWHVQETNIVLLYIVAVLLITRYTNAIQWGIFAAFFSTAAFNFFFTNPKFTLSVYDTDYLITFAGMSAAAIFIGVLSLQARKSAEESFKNRELMEQEKYRANLLRSISHDLRTPLMGIMGTAEVLMSMSADSDPRRKMAEDIYQDADWLHSLVENILGLTRLQDDSIAQKKSREALEEMIASAVAHIEKSHPGYEIGVELPECYIEVEVDARLMTQVFTNLLDNAVKHTLPGNEIKIVVNTRPESKVEIQVLDRGDGIAQADLPHIFEMFYTSAERMADVKHGIGLGLAVSSMVVGSYGGTITAANREDGAGAVFTITLPMIEIEGSTEDVR